jgi:tetratricopeptide (TPR) repeat protein
MASLQEHHKKALTALLVLVGVAALIFYWRVGSESNPGDYQVKKGNYRLEDGQYEEAVKEFSLALEKNPDHIYAHLGLAITYMQMERYEEAEAEFNTTIELAPKMAVAYADRGILYDRAEQYQLALSDYKKALALDSEILEGPGWLWRFMRNVDKKPPGIADRAAYLETELQKPPAERLLNLPEKDQEQRMYKVEE